MAAVSAARVRVQPPARAQYDPGMSPEPGITSPPPPALPTSLLFVDGTNLDHRCLQAFGRDDVDFEKLFAAPYNRASDERRYRKQTGDFNQLRKMPDVTLKLGRHQARQVECLNCGHRYTTRVEKGTKSRPPRDSSRRRATRRRTA